MRKSVLSGVIAGVVMLGATTGCGSSGGGSAAADRSATTSSSASGTGTASPPAASPSSSASTGTSSSAANAGAAKAFSALAPAKLSGALLTAGDVRPVLGAMTTKPLDASKSTATKVTGSGGTCSKLATTASSAGIVSGKPTARSGIGFVKRASGANTSTQAITESVQRFSTGTSPADQLSSLKKLVQGCSKPLRVAASGVKVTIKLDASAPSYGDKTVVMTQTQSKGGVTVVTTFVGIAAGRNYLQLDTLGASASQLRKLSAAAWRQANHPHAASTGADV